MRRTITALHCRFDRLSDLRRSQMVDFLSASLSCLDSGGHPAECVLLALSGAGSGQALTHIKAIADLWRSVVLEGSNSAKQQTFIQLLLPVLRIATHNAMISSINDGLYNTFLSQFKRNVGDEGVSGSGAALSSLQADTGLLQASSLAF